MEAGNGVRTRDLLLGKQSLCQLSYTRSVSLIVGVVRYGVKIATLSGSEMSLHLWKPARMTSKNERDRQVNAWKENR